MRESSLSYSGDDGIVGDLRIRRRDVGLRSAEFRALRAKTAATGFGSEDIGVRDPRSVTSDGDVQTVFERKLHGILQSDFKLVVMDKLIDAWRIDQIGLVNVNGHIRRD